jgi:hypothetical protein
MDLVAEKIRDLQTLVISRKKRYWFPYMVKYDCQAIVELGVFEGANFGKMIEHSPRLAVAIDSWSDDGVLSRNDSALPQSEKDRQYETFRIAMLDKPFVKICRGYTFDVVTQFEDNLFDLIYIDADHTYEGCLRDLVDWWPKMKAGAAFTGDDYKNTTTRTGVRFGVVQAVTEFAQSNNLKVFELPRHGWAIIK